MKTILFLTAFVLLFSVQLTNANTLISKEILGYKIQVIEYETDSLDFSLRVGVSENGTNLRNIMKSVDGISGITGVFTCPKDYSACGGKTTTINERYVKGEKIYNYESTGERVVLGWNEAYEAFIFQTERINSEREDEIYEGLANHPLLILDGTPMTQSYWEKGLIDSKMREKGTRNFICSNQDSSKFYFGLVKLIDIDNLAVVLKNLGCHNAINLDAGFSTAMIYNGEYIVGPGREILDGVFIVPQTLDLDSIEEKAEKISNRIHEKIKAKRQEYRIKKLEGLSEQIENFIKKVNTQFTSDILEQNSVGELQKSGGTQTKLSIEALERVYLLQSLNNQFSHLVHDYKAEIDLRNAIPSFDLRF